jgi:hypothetical protein
VNLLRIIAETYMPGSGRLIDLQSCFVALLPSSNMFEGKPPYSHIHVRQFLLNFDLAS